ncbi:hypothetical protein PR048_015521 [Dryococelus australis]|uniref:G-protein coupled receptors family 1 profile domain-containing protein n=1 Tax=Dryococelus australis TaxID=614101 RepID=A0ABQ9HH62_9NEOP|nr:hypothetical protein PR048_015521 [Dryococelus australis]
MNPDDGPCFSRHVGGAGTMLRVLGAARKREVKATQNLSIIVLFFIICWVPLYTINFIEAMCQSCHVNQTVTNMGIILSHLNSAGNPLLYAYHLRDFRAALKHFLCGLLGPGGGEETANGGQSTRPQFGSQSAIQPRTSRQGSVLSLGTISSRHNRNIFAGDKFRHVCSDSTITRETCLSLATPVASALNGMCKAATLPMTAGNAMWTLAEVSSGHEEERSTLGDDDDKRAGARRRRTVSADGDSGMINCAYIGDVSLYVDDGSTAIVDDEVFVEPCSPSAEDGRTISPAETNDARVQKLSVGNGNVQLCGGGSGVKLSPLKLVGEFFSGIAGEESSAGSNTSLMCEGEAQLAASKQSPSAH